MIKQEKFTQCCGQCCVATILGITLEKAIELVGHNHPTKTKEITKHLEVGSIKRGLPEGDGLCMLRYNKSRNWHWIVKFGDKIYDPLKGKLINVETYFRRNKYYRVSSHFPLLNHNLK